MYSLIAVHAALYFKRQFSRNCFVTNHISTCSIFITIIAFSTLPLSSFVGQLSWPVQWWTVCLRVECQKYLYFWSFLRVGLSSISSWIQADQLFILFALFILRFVLQVLAFWDSNHPVLRRPRVLCRATISDNWFAWRWPAGISPGYQLSPGYGHVVPCRLRVWRLFQSNVFLFSWLALVASAQSLQLLRLMIVSTLKLDPSGPMCLSKIFYLDVYVVFFDMRFCSPWVVRLLKVSLFGSSVLHVDLVQSRNQPQKWLAKKYKAFVVQLQLTFPYIVS